MTKNEIGENAGGKLTFKAQFFVGIPSHKLECSTFLDQYHFHLMLILSILTELRSENILQITMLSQLKSNQ